ncbi:MAG: type II secretion system protein [Rhodocyclaceae bacterium]|nr:type II secretion system protein [Rhodocyclaceae bacterium]
MKRIGFEGGFTYLGVLFAVVLLGVALAATGEVWHTSLRREKEKELLFVGSQFRQALQSYYQKSPGAKEYPQRLEDLVRDNRFPFPVHHLRRIYQDPMTLNTDWGLLRLEGRIVGVYSLSRDRPVKQGGFSPEYKAFEQQESYAGWVFLGVENVPAVQK